VRRVAFQNQPQLSRMEEACPTANGKKVTSVRH
jgi:hypothetical protein